MGGFFFSVSIFVESDIAAMHSFCWLASMELILIPNCSLLYLHSNDIEQFEKFILKKKKRKL